MPQTTRHAQAFDTDAVLRLVQTRIPGLMALYAFGSRITGQARPDSDLDLAALVPGYAPAADLWQLSGELADLTSCPVDLLDLRAASTVMQYQILTTGQRWWAKDAQAALYEAAILSDKTELDDARSGLLDDILERGTIYGR
jgi:predicted nucleotidyltransferase